MADHPALADDPDLVDAIDEAATALAGIAEALARRAAADPDDLLEMLASTADAQAQALRRMSAGATGVRTESRRAHGNAVS